MNIGELATYDEAKGMIKAQTGLSEGVVLHTASALCSGFVAALLSTPADVCKSRVMSGELTCKQMVWWFGAWRVGWCGIASCRSAAAWCYCCCGCGGLKVHQVLVGLFRLCARWCTNGAGTDEEISGLRCSLVVLRI